ncbi:hypothetical protein DPMN_121321 [Dreissena polymorpha]|uniref:Uncharacterized protein n=1 Tax=Dreissena polymorpha TaxID=45954 RepID=A0A9D4GMK4_DREPO|nr:hypothetical protein DPMN_121321 [Dreissena polymorpha]
MLARRKSSTKPNDNVYVNMGKSNKKGVLIKINSDLNVILELSEHLDMPFLPARQQKKMNNELDQSLKNLTRQPCWNSKETTWFIRSHIKPMLLSQRKSFSQRLKVMIEMFLLTLLAKTNQMKHVLRES